MAKYATHNRMSDKPMCVAYIDKFKLREVRHNTAYIGLIQTLTCISVIMAERRFIGIYSAVSDTASNLFLVVMFLLTLLTIIPMGCVIVGPPIYLGMMADDTRYFRDPMEFVAAVEEDGDKMRKAETIANMATTGFALNLQSKIYPYSEAVYGLLCLGFICRADFTFFIAGTVSLIIIIATHFVHKKTITMYESVTTLLCINSSEDQQDK